MSESKRVLGFLNEENANTIAGDLAKCLKKFQDDKDAAGNFDYSFDMSGHIMQDTGKPNTFVDFDLESDMVSCDFLKAMYEDELSEKEEQDLNNFLIQIVHTLTASYSLLIRDTIRSAIFPDASEEDLPLSTVVVKHIEMVDYTSLDEHTKYTLKLKKLPGAVINELIVHETLRAILEEAKQGASREEMVGMVQEEIDKKNPALNGVVGVELGEKFLWDVSLAFLADYSAPEPVENKG